LIGRKVHRRGRKNRKRRGGDKMVTKPNPIFFQCRERETRTEGELYSSLWSTLYVPPGVCILSSPVSRRQNRE
jgi:hypothetical protein